MLGSKSLRTEQPVTCNRAEEARTFGIYPQKEVEISFADITERFERKIVNMPKVADSKNKKDDCTKHLKCGKAVWTLLLKVKVVHFKKTQ